MDTQKGNNNQKNHIKSYCPFFCQKLTYTMLTFDLEEIGLSYFTCALPVTTPFRI